MAKREYPINAAIREIAEALNDPPGSFTREDLAETLYMSRAAVVSWFRTTRPARAPKMALALLCYRKGLPMHPAINARQPRQGPLPAQPARRR